MSTSALRPAPLTPDFESATRWARSTKSVSTAVTDKALVAALGPPYELFNGLGQGGFEQWMMTLASEPEYVDALYGELTDAWLENLRQLQAGGGKAMSFGKSKAKLMTEHHNKVTFADVAGIDEAKLELEEIVEFLRGRVPA